MARKVRGSALHFGQTLDEHGATKEDFYTWLLSHNGGDYWPSFEKPEEITDEETHKLWASGRNGLFGGVIVTARHDQHELYEEKVNGRVVISKKAVKTNLPVQINFFCLRKDTGNGIYTHYKGSLCLNMFLNNLWHAYRVFVRGVRTRANPAESHKYSLSGRAHTGPLFNESGFEKLVKGMKQIEEVRFSTVESCLPDDAPVPPPIKGVSHVYRFKPVSGTSALSWLEWVRNLSSEGRQRRRGAVSGVANDGKKITVDFTETLDNYLIGTTYDDIGTVDTGDLFGHELMRRMVTQISGNQFFSTVINP